MDASTGHISFDALGEVKKDVQVQVVKDGAAVLEAIDVGQRFRISFRDALVVVAARKADASVLYSEDLDHGQTFGPVRVHNPFLESDS